MRIVIVGMGKVGRALTRQLTQDGHDIVVIDLDAAVVEDVVNIYDVRGVVGNGGCYEIQAAAFENGADLLIATTSSDEGNILACLVAKKLNTAHTIARIRNPEYEKQLRFMRQELGVSMVVNPEKATAREISRVLRFPSALKLETFSKQRIELVEYRLGPADPMAGKQLAAIGASLGARVLVCAVSRGNDILIPDGAFTLAAGDTIYLTATPQELEAFFRSLGLFKASAHNVMIVGASKMAYYLAHILCGMKMQVRVIDSDLARCQEMSERLPDALVIHGDGADSDLLNEEGLHEADAFVALTGLDETNIILAMYASQNHDCKVVAKINRRSFADLATAKGMVDSVVSTGSVTVEQIVQYVRAMRSGEGSNIKTLHRLVDERVEALEFGVDAAFPHLNVPLREIKTRKDVLIAGIVRADGSVIIPSGKDVLQPGDDVIVVTTGTDLTDLRDILKR